MIHFPSPSFPHLSAPRPARPKAHLVVGRLRIDQRASASLGPFRAKLTSLSPSEKASRKMDLYVSVTGFRPNGLSTMPAFWWRTLTSLAQARKAQGVVHVSARYVEGTYHTMTVWQDKESMVRFVTSGAHRRAMRNFGALGSGKTYGFSCAHIPDWKFAYRLWCRLGTAV